MTESPQRAVRRFPYLPRGQVRTPRQKERRKGHLPRCTYNAHGTAAHEYTLFPYIICINYCRISAILVFSPSLPSSLMSSDMATHMLSPFYIPSNEKQTIPKKPTSIKMIHRLVHFPHTTTNARPVTRKRLCCSRSVRSCPSLYFQKKEKKVYIPPSGRPYVPCSISLLQASTRETDTSSLRLPSSHKSPLTNRFYLVGVSSHTDKSPPSHCMRKGKLDSY